VHHCNCHAEFSQSENFCLKVKMSYGTIRKCLFRAIYRKQNRKSVTVICPYASVAILVRSGVVVTTVALACPLAV
jgi:hypothetical protein